jgi:hypothetical protein
MGPNAKAAQTGGPGVATHNMGVAAVKSGWDRPHGSLTEMTVIAVAKRPLAMRAGSWTQSRQPGFSRRTPDHHTWHDFGPNLQRDSRPSALKTAYPRLHAGAKHTTAKPATD